MRTHLIFGLLAVVSFAPACSSSNTGESSGDAGNGSSGGSSGGAGSSTGGGSSGSGSSSGVGGGASSSGTASSGGTSGSSSSSGGGSNSSSGSSGAGSSSGNSSGGNGSSSSSGGSGSGGTGHDGGVADAGSSSGASMDGGGGSPLPYPSGPYCAAAGANGHLATGCVIPNLTWMGYVDDAADAVATTKPFRSYSLNDVYNDAHVSGKRYAMINLAEFLCPGCQHSAMELMSGGQAVVQAGGVVVEVLMTDGFTTAAKMNDAGLNDVTAWVDKYMLDVTTVGDFNASTPTLNTLGRRDQAYIVDLTTMTVLQYINGSTSAVTNNSAALAMTAMHTLLGK